MAEVDAATLPYVTRMVDGQEIKFGKFTPRDRANVLKDLRAERRAQLANNLKVSGLPSEQVFTELEAFDATPRYSTADFLSHVKTDEGCDDIFTRSLKKYNAPEAVDKIADGLALSDDESLLLLVEICHLTIGTKSAEKDESAANPTEPGKMQGYGT